jgi:predicted N-formylglutamate amidohydrolase
MKKVKAWAKKQLVKVSVPGSSTVSSIIEDKANMRKRFLLSLHSTTSSMNDKASRKFNNGLPILRRDQISDIADRLEKQLLNELNKQLEQQQLSAEGASCEYFRRSNSLVQQLRSMECFEQTVNQYFAMQP